MLYLCPCQYEQTSCLIYNTGLSDIMKGNVCLYYLLLNITIGLWHFIVYREIIIHIACTCSFSKVLVLYIAAILC